MAQTPDLFEQDHTESVLGDFRRAFEGWRGALMAADRLQRQSSVQVYEDMWQAFTAWCIAQSPQVTLHNLNEEDLQRFLASRVGSKDATLSARHAWRLLSLIDRVLEHDAADRGSPKNSAAAEYIRHSDPIRRANLAERPEIEYLDAEQARRLVTFLSDIRPGAVDRRRLAGWQELRNVAAVAAHLGAGLTPGDLRELLLDAPVEAGGRWKGVPWKLKVPGNGNRRARETPIAPWAGKLLQYWLSVRSQTKLPAAPTADGKGGFYGPYLFPGRSGQQWGKMAHYEAVKAVMEAAEIDDPVSSSGGAFRLRHTFALRQLRRKKSEEDVARWMGIANLDELERYRAVLDSYEEAV